MKKYQKYKDSGIVWVGQIPSHWTCSPFKYNVNIQGRIGYKGYTVSDLVNEGEGVYTIGAKHISKKNTLDLSSPEFISWEKYYESPEIMVFKGDILLTQRGTLGKVVIIEDEIGEATINPSMVLVNKFSANGKFLYYFFCSDYFVKWIDLTNTATAVPMINQQQLGNFKVIFPPKDEQSQIVRYLDNKTNQIEILIANKQKLIELLLEERTAIINHAVTKGINPKAKLKPSAIDWLGDIPEHWEESRFGYQVIIKRGAGYQYIEQVDEDINYEPIIRISDFNNFEPLKAKPRAELNLYRIKKGDILIAGTGATAGMCMLSTEEMEGMVHSYNILRLIPKSANSKFLFHCLSSHFVNEQKGLAFTGSAQPFLDVQRISNFKLVLPKIEEQNLIIEFIEKEQSRIDTIILKTEQEIELMKEYKTALISEVVTGKVDVRDEVIK